MKTGGSHSISRVRTFAGDIASVRGEKPVTKTNVPKKKETVQDVTNTLLKQRTHKAEDFLGSEIEKNTHTKLPTKKAIAPEPKEKKEPKKNQSLKKEKQHKKNNTSRTLVADTKNILNTPEVQKENTSDLSDKATYDISNNDLGGGTIITNKRRRKHRLFPSMYAAIYSWFHKTKEEITTPKKPKHTISKAETRIETITAAARASKHAPQSDHGVVIKRLTKTKRKKHTPEVLIKKKEEIAAPQWSSVQNDVQSKIPHEETLHATVPVNLPTSEDIKTPEIHHELPEKYIKSQHPETKPTSDIPLAVATTNTQPKETIPDKTHKSETINKTSTKKEVPVARKKEERKKKEEREKSL
jgi:hypothetical protein